MDGTTTSLAREAGPASTSLRGDVAALKAFLRRPSLPTRIRGFSAANLLHVLRLYVIDLGIMALLLGAISAAMSSGFKLPDNEINNLDLTAQILLFIIVIGPAVEELGFRSWLSGRPGHVFGALIAVVGVVAAVIMAGRLGQGSPVPAIIGLVTAILAVAVAIALRKRGPMPWFAAAFPLFYALATVTFALAHLYNYRSGALLLLLPLVLPQLIIGAILGYLRVTYGMWANLILHMLHNATFIGLVMVATRFGSA